MAWRNLRSEISEMFADYARGEERLEYVQGLLASRRAREIEQRKAYYAANYRTRIKPAIDAWRARSREKVRAWARSASHLAAVRAWAAREGRLCGHCWKPFKRQFGGGGEWRYCSKACSQAHRKITHKAQCASYYEAHKDALRERKRLWYHANKAKKLAQEVTRG
jgi:hypothetical protein